MSVNLLKRENKYCSEVIIQSMVITVKLDQTKIERDTPVCCTKGSQQHTGLQHCEKKDFKNTLDST